MDSRFFVVPIAVGLVLGGFVPPVGAATATSCNVRGYGIDPDPAGLNVRRTPAANGKVVGQLFSSRDEETDQFTGPWFTITGFSNGWVRVRGADRKTVAVDSATDKSNYQGTGWVRASLVTISLSAPADDAYYTKREHKGYTKPSFQSTVVEEWATTNARLQYVNLGTDPLVLGCSGRWVKVQFRLSGSIDRTGEWTPYEKSDPAYGSPREAWLYGETK